MNPSKVKGTFYVKCGQQYAYIERSGNPHYIKLTSKPGKASTYGTLKQAMNVLRRAEVLLPQDSFTIEQAQ